MLKRIFACLFGCLLAVSLILPAVCTNAYAINDQTASTVPNSDCFFSLEMNINDALLYSEHYYYTYGTVPYSSSGFGNAFVQNATGYLMAVIKNTTLYPNPRYHFWYIRTNAFTAVPYDRYFYICMTSSYQDVDHLDNWNPNKNWSVRAINVNTGSIVDCTSGAVQISNGQSNGTALFRLTIPANCTEVQFQLGLSHYFYTTQSDFVCAGAWFTTSTSSGGGGDYDAVLSEILSYLQRMNLGISDLNTLMGAVSRYLSSIDLTVSNIYDILNGALQAEGDSLSESSKAAVETIQQTIDSERYWEEQASTAFASLSFDFAGLVGGVTTGLAFVGTQFTNLWDALGDYTKYILFGLYLGIVLLIVGRLARGSK